MVICYSNPFPVFQPAMRIIADITRSDPAIVTTTIDHDYITGEIVRLDLPLGFGMQQVNQKTGTIVVITPTTFAINIDTRYYDIFSVPMATQQCAQVIPIGEDNSILTAATVNVLPSGER